MLANLNIFNAQASQGEGIEGSRYSLPVAEWATYAKAKSN